MKTIAPLLFIAHFGSAAMAETAQPDSLDLADAYMTASNVTYQRVNNNMFSVRFDGIEASSVLVDCNALDLAQIEREHTKAALDAALLNDRSLLQALGEVQDAFDVCLR